MKQSLVVWALARAAICEMLVFHMNADTNWKLPDR